MAKDGISIEVKGLGDLIKKLDAMSAEFAAKNIVSSAYSANNGMVTSIQNQIASKGLVDTGLLEKSIKRKKIIYAKDGTVVIITGVSKNAKGVDRNGKPRIPWRYANVLEPKFNFVKDGFDVAKQAVVEKFVDSLKRKIKKFEKNNPNPTAG
jgi:hypothetical protein